MSGTKPFIDGLTKHFRAAADPENAAFQKAYMKDQFEFFGIKTGQRRIITKDHFRLHALKDHEQLEEITKKLWELPQREYHYAGQELLYHYKKIWTDDTIGLIEYCITHQSWWDTVDYLSTYGAGNWFVKYPARAEKITHSWNRSNNMWLNRCSILFQLKYKGNTDPRLLSNYIMTLSGSKEFFIQKAIGWALREYSKTDPAWVRQFIKDHTLAALSVREGSKYTQVKATSRSPSDIRFKRI
jgi:3-methyladenine DNA glycosylase AlkD